MAERLKLRPPNVNTEQTNVIPEPVDLVISKISMETPVAAVLFYCHPGTDWKALGPPVWIYCSI